MVDKNQEDITKYLKKKFAKLQEVHFTVPNLVGEGPKFEYNYLGEFLDETYRKNKETFESLDLLTKATSEKLLKLEEFVDFQCRK